MTPSDRTLGGLRPGSDELAWRAVSEPAVGMDVVVVVHPVWDRRHRGSSGGDRVHADVVALERLHEGLGHAVALGAFDRSEAGIEIEGKRDVDGLGGDLRP